MRTYKFDESVYVVGDAYRLHKFIHPKDKQVVEKNLYGILTSYSPDKLTFLTNQGMVYYEADVNLKNDDEWHPADRFDSKGKRHDIVMGGLTANTDAIEKSFKYGSAYYVKTPDDWVNVPSFIGIYAGYDPNDLWNWPRLKFKGSEGEIEIGFVHILRKQVEIYELTGPDKLIQFNEEENK